MKLHNTTYRLIKNQAKISPNSIVLRAPERLPLTYSDLWRHIEMTVKKLRAWGINRNDRVALVLPNGPEMAAAFLTVASAATSAPLNPNYRPSEFDFYLTDLRTKALIVHTDLKSPARDVALSKGIPIIELAPELSGSAGIFCLKSRLGDMVSSSKDDLAHPSDTALVLHTSGTTSRPKIVPLTHSNIHSSAFNIIKSLELSTQDSCLNIMPLFHIHGLMAALLASVCAGSSVICTEVFDVDNFFKLLAEFRPTWYSAVPTMHQAILGRADNYHEVVEDSSLRFIRSSSASLPPKIMAKLEELFRAPVIEAYGMTEASHQMASNPLPPKQRKPGTVGLAAGPKVRIMDEAGDFLNLCQIGEIVIRGANVTLGYEKNPEANKFSFLSGWFRTGDQGFMDHDSYLTITGRLKEIVNRGGEKVAPREIDEVLLDHPDVLQAVAFAVPHPSLGEDLVAAVIVQDGISINEHELRQFTFKRLSDYKVPSQIIVVGEIPKGATGKIQRIGLAEKLAGKLQARYVPPANSLEALLAASWEKILGVARVGINDNFFALGGDSLSAGLALLEIEELLGKELPPTILFQAPTISQLSNLLKIDLASVNSYLVPIQAGGESVPLFCVPGHGGDVFTFFELSRHLRPERPVYACRFPREAEQNDDVANEMLTLLASRYIDEIKAIYPNGPILLIGYCFGGEVAFEMAHRLRSQGTDTPLLGIIFAYQEGAIRTRGLRNRILYQLASLRELTIKDKVARLWLLTRKLFFRMARKLYPLVGHHQFLNSSVISTLTYYPASVTLFRPVGNESENLYYDPQMGWGGLAANIKVYDLPGDKITVFKEPHVRILAEHLNRCIEDAVNKNQS